MTRFPDDHDFSDRGLDIRPPRPEEEAHWQEFHGGGRGEMAQTQHGPVDVWVPVVDLNSEVGRLISDALHSAGSAHAGTALESLRYHGLSGELSYRGGSVGLGPLT